MSWLKRVLGMVLSTTQRAGPVQPVAASPNGGEPPTAERQPLSSKPADPAAKPAQKPAAKTKAAAKRTRAKAPARQQTKRSGGSGN
jgi:hypothetical protein